MKLLIYMFYLILIIIMILNFLSLILSKKMLMNREKNISFECGFDLFNSSRMPFSIQFYLIGILFLVFDVEIILMFPIINSLNFLNYYIWIYCSLMVLLILYLGLEFEKYEGSLKWFM
uniref:NADH-ubiquinone oxidoreductase chain 3 n=1 Tax=Macrocentrus camphoraphilus TaxID=684659 RepID=D8WHD1_9HYME|nr:NADH dehydrogenase subunit 3 [Macrocentrus camphoraphilus]